MGAMGVACECVGAVRECAGTVSVVCECVGDVSWERCEWGCYDCCEWVRG